MSIPIEFIQKYGMQHKNPDDEGAKNPSGRYSSKASITKIMEQQHITLAQQHKSHRPLCDSSQGHKTYETLLHEHVKLLESSDHIAVIELDNRILQRVMVTLLSIPLCNIILMTTVPGTEEEPLFLDICETPYPGEIHFFIARRAI
jgi:hypothetical protein